MAARCIWGSSAMNGFLVQQWANHWFLMRASRFQPGNSTVWSRFRYVARLTYWTARHRSIATGRWVIAFEGLTW